MSREWLTLVEKGKQKSKFSPSSSSPSSFILLPWQLTTIKHRSLYSYSFIRYCSFVASWPSIAAVAVAPVLFAFLPPTSAQFMYIHTFSLDSTTWEDQRQAGRPAKPSYSQLHCCPIAGDSPLGASFLPKEHLLVPSRLFRLSQINPLSLRLYIWLRSDSAVCA